MPVSAPPGLVDEEVCKVVVGLDGLALVWELIQSGRPLERRLLWVELGAPDRVVQSLGELCWAIIIDSHWPFAK